MGLITRMKTVLLIISKVSDLIYHHQHPNHAWFSSGDGLELALFLSPAVALVGSFLFFRCAKFMQDGDGLA
jgi:hypothetical protein